MATDILVRARKTKTGGKSYEYRFEMASIGGKRQWSSKGGYRSEKAARIAGIAALNAYNACGKPLQRNEMSFADFLETWMESECVPTLKESTVLNYQKKIKNHIRPYLGHYRLNSIQREKIQELLCGMHNNGYAKNTLLVVKGILTKSLNYAVEAGYLLTSPATGVKIPKFENTAIPTRTAPRSCLSDAELATIMQRFPEGNPAFLPLLVGYHCGLRIGEAFALTWEDIDLKAKTITVRRQIQWRQNVRTAEEKQSRNGRKCVEAGAWYFTSPKYNSQRTIDIDTGLATVLMKEKAQQQEAASSLGSEYQYYYEDEHHVVNQRGIGIEVQFVFVRTDGSYINTRTMQYTSKIIHEQLGIAHFDYHSLRHTHTTTLLERGAPLKYVQKRLGHKNIDITLNIYQHLTEGMKERGRFAIKEMTKYLL